MAGLTELGTTIQGARWQWRRAVDVLASALMIAAGCAILWNSNRSTTSSPQRSTASDRVDPIGKVVSIDGAAVKGNLAAKVALIEYSDFECPFCGTFARETLPQIIAKYVDTGQLVLVFVPFPLETIHPQALDAAAVVGCAQGRGQFWPMHDMLFSGGRELDRTVMSLYWKKAGLLADDFERCLTGDQVMRVRDGVRSAKTIGITGTPTLLLGSLSAQSVTITQRIRGNASFLAMDQALSGLLHQSSR